MRTKLIAGNWKMHGSHKANAELLEGILGAGPLEAEVAVCVPFPYLSEVAVALAGSAVHWGAQDCSAHEQGAYTGEVSAAMLHEFGCRYAIVGHSERRQYHAEADQLVADKAKAVLARGITPIVCVGETLQQREAGETGEVVKRQLSAVIHTLAHCAGEIVVAYEPVWAIGTGDAASGADAQQVAAQIRAILRELDRDAADGVPIQYGGSVTGDNAAEFLGQPDIDGALVGGASLKPDAFAAILRAAASAA
jgi:triosephosphate isomerase (TIM)